MGLIRAWRAERRAALPPMSEGVKSIAMSAKGFLSEADGLKLYELAWAASADGPCLEVGSYCGKSALFIADGCRARGRYGVFSVDHHRGSEEQQRGEEYFDPELFDAANDRVDTLPHFVANIRRAELEQWIFPIVGDSAAVAGNWADGALAMVFIDGGHAKETVENDYRGWGRVVKPGGLLCFHDIYPDPADGGQAPFEVFEAARNSGRWRLDGLYGCLGVLRRR
jgi:predicted O-methyltransferase YrrM